MAVLTSLYLYPVGPKPTRGVAKPLFHPWPTCGEAIVCRFFSFFLFFYCQTQQATGTLSMSIVSLFNDINQQYGLDVTTNKNYFIMDHLSWILSWFPSKLMLRTKSEPESCSTSDSHQSFVLHLVAESNSSPAMWSVLVCSRQIWNNTTCMQLFGS